MKRLFLLLALVGMVAVGCTEGGGELDENGNGGNGGVTPVKNNIIEYTTTDALPLGPYNTDAFGTDIMSNTYENGKGVLVFENDITTIGKQAFYQCARLKSVVLPNSITEIGENAFAQCTALRSVKFGDKVESFGDSAFNGCTDITTIDLPNSLTAIGNGTFRDCKGLESITLSDNVTELGERAFYLCDALKEVVIGNSVPAIKYDTFSECKSLSSITLGENVAEIGNYAFNNCQLLENIVIPDKCTSIGKNAFNNCKALASISIGSGVAQIGNSAFNECSALVDVNIKSLSSWCKIKFDSPSANPLYYGGDLLLNESKVTSLTIPSDVTEVLTYSFYNYADLTDVTFHDKVTAIGSASFYNTLALATITFKGATPPTVASNAFSTSDTARESNPVIYVPKGSYDDYLGSNWPTTYKQWISADGNELEEGFIIEYTTTDGAVADVQDSFGDAKIVLNSYENGKGTILLSKAATTIGYSAFYGCNTLQSIVIPDSVTSIGRDAFSECHSLPSITIPDSVTEIGDYAFNNCTSLTSVTIGNGVTSIGYEAFHGCTSLTSVTIPDSVTSIGKRAFSDCTSLTSVDIYDLSAWCNIDFEDASANPLCQKGSFFVKGVEQTEITIPSGVENIKQYAFFNCTSLTSITIPESVTKIGDYAFSDCTSLTSITIPESVTKIGDYAFRNCTSLTSVDIYDLSAWCKIGFGNNIANPLRYGAKLYLNGSELTDITIPSDITEIKDFAFYGCTSLTSITIPDSVTSIGDDAFWGCTSLTSVDIYDLSAWCNIDFEDVSSNPLYQKGSFFVKGVEQTEITIPSGVENIKQYAFYNCTSLTSVTIPNSVTSIGSSAFSGCSSLSSVYFNGTTPPTLSSNTFSINYSDSTKNPKIYIPSGAEAAYLSSTWNNTYKSWIVLEDYSNVSNYIIEYTTSDNLAITPNTTAFGATIIYNIYNNDKGIICCAGEITSIGDSAFEDCSSLASITIPDSVTSIGGEAFHGCTSLVSVTITDSVTSIGKMAFANCPWLTYIYVNITDLATYATSNSTYRFPGNIKHLFVNGTEITELVIPDSVTTIGEWAFYNCGSLTSVTIPDSVTTIGDSAFDNCYSLTSVTIGDSVTSIGDNAFYDCDRLTSVYISDISAWCNISFSNTYSNPLIYNNLYLNNELVTDLIIPDSVTTIGDSAFQYCSSLTSVTIGDSVTRIGDAAFQCCSSLTSVTIGDSVTRIGEAFRGCRSLTSVYCKATTPPSLGFYAFKYDYSGYYSNIGCDIYVPTESVEAYKAAKNWSNYASYIVGYDF